jgi:urease accessory protein
MSSQSERFARFPLAAIAIALPTAAWAHTGIGATSGFAHGFLHPVSGLDHVLAMVAVGLFAATLGGRAVRAVPLTFMALMVVGGALGMAGITLPHVETAIALSVVVLGAAVAVHWQWPVAAAMALVGVFAIFHGHVHGAEMPESISGAEYALGFLLATGVLHLVGLSIRTAVAMFDPSRVRRVMHVGGGAITVVGIGLLMSLV